MRRLFLAASLALAAPAAQAQVPADLGVRVTEGYIRPATQQFANSAAALSGSLDFLCREPGETRLDTVRTHFRILTEAWFRVFFLRFGPLIEDNRFDRIFFWPDPRGIILRQVQDVIARQDATAIDPASLAGKSIAVQGLPALEFALFGSGSEQVLETSNEGRYRCAYALAIAESISRAAAGVAEAWGPSGAYAKDFTNPGPANATYRSETEVAAEVVKSLAGGFAFLADVVIAPFLGREPEQANVKRAPFWRSDGTVGDLMNGVGGLSDFYTATGFAETVPEADRWIDGSLRLEMRQILETLGGLDMPLDDMVRPGPGREALVYTVIALKSLHTTVDTQLARAVGVTVGFNALDGD